MIARRKQSLRQFAYERLEERALLTIFDLAAIAGRVFRDALGDGFNQGEQVSGAAVELYRDDGNGTLDSGDTRANTAATDADGKYRFDHLTPGTYFVVQPSQTVGSVELPHAVSDPLVLSSTDVQGVSGTSIDTFDQTTHSAFAAGTQSSGVSVSTAPEAIGGSRKLQVQLTGSGGGLALSANTLSNGPQVLDFHESGAGGVHVVTWDGSTAQQSTLNPTGLGGVDLTDGGASTGMALFIGGDAAGDQIRITLLSSGTAVSSATLTIPFTSGRNQSQLYPLHQVYVPFDGFMAHGAGADFSKIGAIQITWLNDESRTNGQIDSIEAIGPTLRTHDFDNFLSEVDFVDLELSMSADRTSSGDVVFSITVENVGTTIATNVVVTDLLPTGLAFVSASSSSYDSLTGEWLLGSLDAGTNTTLTIIASITSTGQLTNTAEVTFLDQEDVDSTPDNEDLTEDDQARVTITPEPNTTENEPLILPLNVKPPGPVPLAVAFEPPANLSLPLPVLFLFTPSQVTTSVPVVVSYGGSGAIPDSAVVASPRRGDSGLRLRFHEIPEEQLQQVLLTLAETVMADAEVADLADVQLARNLVKVPELPKDFLEAPEEPQVEAATSWNWYLAASAGLAFAGSLVVMLRPKLVQRWFQRGSWPLRRQLLTRKGT